MKKDEEILKQAESNHEKEMKIIEDDDLNAIDADTVTCGRKRGRLAKSIPADLLAQYERIRKRNNGIGVIPVWKAVCSGCRQIFPSIV